MAIALICVLVSSIILSVLVCFTKNKFFPYTSSLIVLFALSMTTMAYKESFDAYSIMLTLSIVPLFLTTYESKENELHSALFKGIAFFLSGACITFCSLYLGKETYLGALIGLAAALALTFLFMLVQKTFLRKGNLLQILSVFLAYLGAGLLLGTIAPVILYSTSLTNILFVVGAVLFASHIIVSSYCKNRFNYLIYVAGILLLISTIYVG